MADTENTLAWHSNPDLKTEVVARMTAHRADDSIIQGIYQQIDPDLASGYRGCLIGCTLPPQAKGRGPRVGWHHRVEELYGIPTDIGHLLDRIFENLPTDDGQHARFAVASIEAIPVGADLSLVASRLMLDILADPAYGVLTLTIADSKRQATIERVIGLYRRRLAGDEPSRQEWLEPRKGSFGVNYAYEQVSGAAAYAAAWREDSYAFSEAMSSAAYNAGWTGSVSDWWTWAAARLLHHLAHAPIPVKI